jgi:hypothetical protein
MEEFFRDFDWELDRFVEYYILFCHIQVKTTKII